MTEAMKFVLAACDGQGQPIAYLSTEKDWTSNILDAVCFDSQHEADDYFHATPHDGNPGPVRSVSWPQGGQAGKDIPEISASASNQGSNQGSNQEQTTRLFTGIYG